MYHAIVRKKVTQSIEELSPATAAASLDGFVPNVEHYFAGRHALGGTRHSREALGRWFERVFRLLPDLTFKVQRIVVSGGPWNTTATAEWKGTATSVTGVPYANHGVHVIRMRLGKIQSMHVYVDSEVLADVLRQTAEQGAEEAAARPIQT